MPKNKFKIGDVVILEKYYEDYDKGVLGMNGFYSDIIRLKTQLKVKSVNVVSIRGKGKVYQYECSYMHKDNSGESTFYEEELGLSKITNWKEKLRFKT